ncbi:unnamed protein product, partial [Staurois parvus]
MTLCRKELTCGAIKGLTVCCFTVVCVSTVSTLLVCRRVLSFGNAPRSPGAG